MLKSLASVQLERQAGTMTADKDVELSEMTLLRQHPNHRCLARVRTTAQTNNPRLTPKCYVEFKYD